MRATEKQLLAPASWMRRKDATHFSTAAGIYPNRLPTDRSPTWQLRKAPGKVGDRKTTTPRKQQSTTPSSGIALLLVEIWDALVSRHVLTYAATSSRIFGGGETLIESQQTWRYEYRAITIRILLTAVGHESEQVCHYFLLANGTHFNLSLHDIDRAIFNTPAVLFYLLIWTQI